MTNSLFAEYNTMKKRYHKLVAEKNLLEKEHRENVKYFINKNVSDKEWQSYLEKTACYLTVSSIKIKITKNKIKEIRILLFKK